MEMKRHDCHTRPHELLLIAKSRAYHLHANIGHCFMTLSAAVDEHMNHADTLRKQTHRLLESRVNRRGFVESSRKHVGMLEL